LAVQTPQQSVEGLLKSVRSLIGFRLDPLSCHKDMVWAMGSMMVKRNRRPLGSQRSQKARPGSEA
jgi:hypothetical protein